MTASLLVLAAELIQCFCCGDLLISKNKSAFIWKWLMSIITCAERLAMTTVCLLKIFVKNAKLVIKLLMLMWKSLNQTANALWKRVQGLRDLMRLEVLWKKINLINFFWRTTKMTKRKQSWCTFLGVREFLVRLELKTQTQSSDRFWICLNKKFWNSLKSMALNMFKTNPMQTMTIQETSSAMWFCHRLKRFIQVQ